MTTYEVAVGNVGIVHVGNKVVDAKSVFSDYVRQSKAGRGRAAHEGVSLFRDGELLLDYTPPTPEQQIDEWLTKNPLKAIAIAKAVLGGLLYLDAVGGLRNSVPPSDSELVHYIADCANAQGFDKVLEKIRSTQTS